MGHEDAVVLQEQLLAALAVVTLEPLAVRADDAGLEDREIPDQLRSDLGARPLAVGRAAAGRGQREQQGEVA